MNDYEEIRNILNRVKDLFQKLLFILETAGDHEVNYAQKELGRNIRALEEVLGSNSDLAEAEEVLENIKISFKSMYPPRGGLSDFFVWREDYEERLKANKRLESIQSELREIFEF